jgi:hypothetical protein
MTMRVVLYAEDMEPITVIDLPPTAWKYLIDRSVVRIAVMIPPKLQVVTDSRPQMLEDIKTVSIYAERFIRKGCEHTMLFTHDEESALLLKCAFLPGQNAELQARERTAFERGFVDALVKLGDCGENSNASSR